MKFFINILIIINIISIANCINEYIIPTPPIIYSITPTPFNTTTNRTLISVN